MLVQALIAQAPIQASNEADLLRLARRDLAPLDRTLLLPAPDRVRGQLGTIAHQEDGSMVLEHFRLELGR